MNLFLSKKLNHSLIYEQRTTTVCYSQTQRFRCCFVWNLFVGKETK